MDNSRTNIDSDSFSLLLKKGEKVAYETLFRLYYDKLLHIAKGYVGNVEDAEGIVQNVFLKIWKKRKNFDEIDNINNYLFTMIRNASMDHLRRLKVKRTYSKRYYEEKMAIQYIFLKDDAASTILEEELNKRIVLALDSLPEKCKRVFIQSRVEGMKNREIAKKLQISIRTVDNHISNALKHMRLHLKEFLTFFF